MAAADLTESRCASERGLAMGGGRPAESRFTVGGSGKSVARCHRTVLAYWKFESISLQQTVWGSPRPGRYRSKKPRFRGGVCRCGRQRHDVLVEIAQTGAVISVE